MLGDEYRNGPIDWDFLEDFDAEPGSAVEPSSAVELGSAVEPSSERSSPSRWSEEEKARIVRESFWPGERVGDVAERYGLSSRRLSSWRSLAREGKLVLPSSMAEPEPEPIAAPEPAFATVEVDPPPVPELGLTGSVSIKARGVTVRLDGDIGARRIAEIASLLRALR